MLSQALIFLHFLPIAYAHFTLDSPASRHYDEETLATFPCGGQDTPSSNRTSWSLTGGPIQLTMGHDESAIQVLLGLGNDVGENFNITLLPTIQEQGPGSFCMGDVVVPDGVAREGMNATIQVVTNGDPSGGLYNCADITFTSSAPANAPCKNATVRVTDYQGPVNANGTGPAATTASTSGSGTAAAPSPTGAAGKVSMGAWGLLVGGAALGAAALL